MLGSDLILNNLSNLMQLYCFGTIYLKTLKFNQNQAFLVQNNTFYDDFAIFFWYFHTKHHAFENFVQRPVRSGKNEKQTCLKILTAIKPRF
jgi:hypothetical protein